MYILALETSGKFGSVALLRSDQTLFSGKIGPNQRTAADLAPLMAGLLKKAGIRPGDVGLVAVTRGPGSFTGLRIGITTAKVFAYATGARVVGVDTLAALASQIATPFSHLDVIMDAQRKELFVGSFSAQPLGELRNLTTAKIVGRETWLKSLQPKTLVCGPALSQFQDLPRGVQVAEPVGHDVLAESVGRMGYAAAMAGTFDDLWTLAPTYFRKSAAEEKRDAGQGK